MYILTDKDESIIVNNIYEQMDTIYFDHLIKIIKEPITIHSWQIYYQDDWYNEKLDNKYLKYRFGYADSTKIEIIKNYNVKISNILYGAK